MYLTSTATTGWSTRRWLSIITLLLACFHIQLTSAGLFGGKSSSIREDYVYLDTSTFSISADNTAASSEITSGVRVVPNTAAVSDKGLEGIGYILDAPCVGLPNSNTANNNVRTTYARIALISLDNCTLDWKITRAQNDHASGVIIYSPNGDDVSFDNLHFSVPIVIPAFAISSNDGLRMSQNIASSQLKPAGVSSASQRQIRFTLLANEKSFPSVWEFTLIIVVVLLFLSLVISVAMHCHLYRLRRNYALRNNIPDGTEMMVIHKSALGKLPIKVWHAKGDLRARPALGKNEENHQFTVVMEPPPAYDPKSMISPHQLKSDDEETAQSVCPICLDDFKDGEEVRELPCCHYYHLECIDPWLTTKSGTCPMCKLPISSDLTPAYLPPENTSWWYSIASSIFAPCMLFCR
ncbi:hypothetical protein K493DRAFT_332896 [Basidiobolus meristosporus CBS 931.73]|uniref:RING-type domain-containing protein n=1 Tax=Basidiobolus meristosporus CBS 931.73 TaxID=1314790 RepID=A0A1Y1ZAK1_9FUNG|nr:hypothetical protein K493DRAFT_332896 [Basidiobolus meristosporus CBS 931.73]|eukprot:ORY07124.1 hypothetical protein K493DRAFT_332896 [Basidiobolus meristosporus CBS 931.73]